MSSSTISKNAQLYSGYDTRSVADSQVYPLLYNADVWVDASDTSSFTLTGTGIQKQLSGNWSDKSRNANHLVPTATGIYYDDQTSGFALNTQYFMPTTAIRSGNSETFFLVVDFWGSDISSTQYILGFNPTNSVGQRLFRVDTVGLRTLSNATDVLVGANPIIEAQRYLLGFSNNNGFLQHFINGKLDGTAAALTTFTSTNPTAFFGNAGSNVQLRGVIHECLFYQSTLSSNQRQLIEYYLMNKWKIPSTTLSSPTSITGCSLWLDASDTSSITLSGSSVTQWNDKSGNSNHAVGITSFLPTYTTGTQVNFTGAQGLRSNYVPATAGETIFLVMKCTTLNGTIQQYFIDSSNTTSGRNYRLPTSATKKWYAANGGTTTLAGIVSFTTQSYTKSMLYCGVIAGTGGTAQYINKIRDITASATNSPVAGTYTQIGARSNPPANGLNGSISEIIAYNTVISASNRELVSNYLMNKWSIFSLNGTFINQYNSFQRIPPAMKYFTPNDIENCILWLDAADTTTLFTDSAGTIPIASVGDSIGYWRDKSTTKNNAIQSTAGSRPILATNSTVNRYVLTFDGSNDFFNLTGTLLPTGAANVSTFIVSRSTTLATSSSVISWGNGSNGANGTHIIIGYGVTVGTSNFLSMSTVNNSQDDTVNVVNTYTILSSVILTSPGTTSGWRTGTAFTQSPYNTPVLNVGSVYAYVGASYNGTAINLYSAGQIAEIIMYNRKIGNAEREQIEGYLADKWGLRPNLPLVHSLKDINTLSAPFNPKSISTCTFWYDIADSSTLTYASGSTVNVTNITDKSGYGINLVRDVYTAGREVTTANTLNGLPTLTFPGDPAGNNATLTYLRSTVSVPVVSAANYAFFVMRFNPFVLEGTTTARTWPFIYPFNIGVVNGPQFGMLRTGTNWTLQYGISNVGTGGLGTAVISTSSSGPSVGTPLIGVVAKTGAAQYVFSYNGTYETVVGTSATVLGGQPLNVGIFYQAQELCELIYYNGRVLTTGEIQKIEGYLAWKWKLVSLLPSTHSYKKVPP